MARPIRLPALIAATWAALPVVAMAALPPVVQNARDLDVMVGFVRQHPAVLQTLKAIDLQGLVVRFGADCEARFGREASARVRPGPAPPLEFRDSNCPIGAARPQGTP